VVDVALSVAVSLPNIVDTFLSECELLGFAWHCGPRGAVPKGWMQYPAL